MTMPIDLVLVRHGLSEGNVASKRSRRGDDSLYTPEFRSRHSSQWRLTDLGIQQAQAAGRYLRDTDMDVFDRYYASEYLRALETAVHLDLPDAKWFLDFYLRERDWGDMEPLSHAEKQVQFAVSMATRKRDSFYWTPPNGDSMATVCLRVDRILDTLHRECAEKRVIIVSHGELMWAFRIRLERMTQRQYYKLDQSKKPFDKIHNCQILHYTRRDPDTGTLMPHLGWMRSICPWDLTRSSNRWQVLRRQSYTADDLRAILEQAPRIVNE